MQEDLWRLVGILLFSLLVGLLSGHVLLSLFAGIAAYLYWHFRLLQQLLVWLRQRSEKPPADYPGLIDDIAREFDSLRLRYRRRKEKLSGFLRRFQEATAALPDAAVVLGEHDRIEWANSLAEDYLDIRWPQDAGNRIVNLIRHPDLPAFLVGPETSSRDQRLVMQPPGKPGLWLELRIAPYGETQRLLVGRDITKLQQITQMRQDFIANASHELRTPLTVISGYLENIDEDKDLLPGIRSSQIRQMRIQAQKMQHLVDDLLKLASLESQAETNLSDVVRVPELINLIRIEAATISGTYAHRFNVESDARLYLRANHSELYSAFSNLVFNAVQYTGAQGEIRIRWYEDSAGAHLAVIDTGTGIESEHIPRLTERFYRVDKGRSRGNGGTGLGLAIVKHVLLRHRATLEIESEVGKGSVFTCHFPPELIIHKPG